MAGGAEVRASIWINASSRRGVMMSCVTVKPQQGGETEGNQGKPWTRGGAGRPRPIQQDWQPALEPETDIVGG